MNELQKREIGKVVEQVTGMEGGQKYAVATESGEGYEVFDGRTRRRIGALPEGAVTFYVVEQPK